MRLRLWWHLYVLDSRAPEDQGFELTLDTPNHGLRLPLNINDNQIFPNMTQLPTETTGWTEMSFFLIQTESCKLLHPVLGTREPFSADVLPDITAKRKLIHERWQHVAMKYGLTSITKTPPPNNLPHIAMQHFTTVRKKMEFMLQLRQEISLQKGKRARSPRGVDTGVTDTPNESFRPSFRLACESMGSNSILLKSGVSLGFRWLFTTYTPWYALAYVLRCLCSCPSGEEAERAWALVEAVFPPEMSLDGDGLCSMEGHAGHVRGQTQRQGSGQGQGSIWKCLALLRSQALSLKRARSQSRQPSALSEDGHNEGEMQRQPRLVDQHYFNGVPSSALTQTAAPAAVMPAPFPEFGALRDEQAFLADASSTSNMFSGVDFSMPEIPFLPEWNAVINGCLVGDGDDELW